MQDFPSCKMSSIKIWFLLATGLAENLTCLVVVGGFLPTLSFVIQHDNG